MNLCRKFHPIRSMEKCSKSRKYLEMLTNGRWWRNHATTWKLLYLKENSTVFRIHFVTMVVLYQSSQKALSNTGETHTTRKRTLQIQTCVNEDGAPPLCRFLRKKFMVHFKLFQEKMDWKKKFGEKILANLSIFFCGVNFNLFCADSRQVVTKKILRKVRFRNGDCNEYAERLPSLRSSLDQIVRATIYIPLGKNN